MTDSLPRALQALTDASDAGERTLLTRLLIEPPSNAELALERLIDVSRDVLRHFLDCDRQMN